MKKIGFCIEVTDEQKAYVQSHVKQEITFFEQKGVTVETLNQFDMIAGNVNHNKLKASSVKYAHLESAGCNQYLDCLPEKVLSCSTGAYGEVISEYMLTNVLLFTTRMKQYMDASVYHQWKNLGKIRSISDLNVLVVGCGDIGSTFGKKMNLLGAHVDGIKQNINMKIDGIDHLYQLDKLKDIISNYDVVALSLPQTEQTINILDYEVMSLMKKDSILLNVGRGSAIHTSSLIKLLKEGWFSGVYLDVVDQEPLPMNSYLWNDEKVIITPHISGGYSLDHTFQKVLDIAIENINRYIDDLPILNEIDPNTGYAKK